MNNLETERSNEFIRFDDFEKLIILVKSIMKSFGFDSKINWKELDDINVEFHYTNANGDDESISSGFDPIVMMIMVKKLIPLYVI